MSIVQLDKYMLFRVKSWLMGWAQGVTEMGLHQAVDQSLVGFPRVPLRASRRGWRAALQKGIWGFWSTAS